MKLVKVLVCCALVSAVGCSKDNGFKASKTKANIDKIAVKVAGENIDTDVDLIPPTEEMKGKKRACNGDDIDSMTSFLNESEKRVLPSIEERLDSGDYDQAYADIAESYQQCLTFKYTINYESCAHEEVKKSYQGVKGVCKSFAQLGFKIRDILMAQEKIQEPVQNQAQPDGTPQ